MPIRLRSEKGLAVAEAVVSVAAQEVLAALRPSAAQSRAIGHPSQAGAAIAVGVGEAYVPLSCAAVRSAKASRMWMEIDLR